MVSIVHKGERSEKPEIILDAAQKLLGLYGYEKTTMNEIASDLSMSKAALYYYFPDKESIFMAVIGREREQFLTMIHDRLRTLKDPEKMLFEFIRLRQDYFRKFLNLNKARFKDFRQLKPHFRESYETLRQNEKSIVRKILLTGTEQGIFICPDLSSMAALFLDVLYGLRMTVIENKSFHEITPDDHRMIAEKHRIFCTQFIRGLKNKMK